MYKAYTTETSPLGLAIHSHLRLYSNLFQSTKNVIDAILSLHSFIQVDQFEKQNIVHSLTFRTLAGSFLSLRERSLYGQNVRPVTSVFVHHIGWFTIGHFCW